MSLAVDGRRYALPSTTEPISLMDFFRLIRHPFPGFGYRMDSWSINRISDDPMTLVKLAGLPGYAQAPNVVCKAGLDVQTMTKGLVLLKKGHLINLLRMHHGDCVAPCNTGCPGNTFVNEYIQTFKQGDVEGAILFAKLNNPMISVCGYLCPGPCYSYCNRAAIDSPVKINEIKRYLADLNYSQFFNINNPLRRPDTGKRVAIIGAGPAGLTAAYFLGLRGHSCTLFDEADVPGGQLVQTIFRMPKEMLKKEIGWMLDVSGSRFVGKRHFTRHGPLSIESLRHEFEKCIVAIGRMTPLRIGLSESPSMIDGISFLRSQLKTSPRWKHLPDFKDKSVVIVGGGYVSIDCARLLIRLGADVSVTCVESLEQLSDGTTLAKQEGVAFFFLTQPLLVLSDPGGNILGLEVCRLQYFDSTFSSENRLKDSEFTIKCQYIIDSIGQCVDFDIPDLPRTSDRSLLVENLKINGFCYGCGDAVIKGGGLAIDAIALGRRAALFVDRDLGGSFLDEEKVLNPLADGLYTHSRLGPDKIRREYYAKYPELAKIEPEPVSLGERLDLPIDNFTDFKTYSESEAQQEAARCLDCGCQDASECKLREACTHLGIQQSDCLSLPASRGLYSPDDSNPFFVRDLDKCVSCRLCIRICRDVVGFDAFAGRSGKRLLIDLPDPPCETCGACVDACPTQAIYPAKKERKSFFSRKIKTVCPYCAVGCGLSVDCDEYGVIHCSGDEDHSVNRGKLCMKGRFLINDVPKPLLRQRLTRPLLRKAGVLKEVSWEEALDFTADSLLEIISTHGCRSVAGFACAKATNETNYVFQKFLRCVIGTPHVDNCARLCHSSTISALGVTLGIAAMTQSIEEFESMKVLLLIGCNVTETAPIIGHAIRRAVRLNGCRLIVIDPRRTEIVKQAELYAQIKPGSDIAFIATMTKIIIDEGLYDHRYVAKRTSGFEELKQEILKINLKRSSEACGVELDLLSYIAHVYASERAAIVYSTGITQHTNGTDNVFGLSNLALLCGKRCGGIIPLQGQNNVQGACDVGCLSEFLPGYQNPTSKIALASLARLWEVSPDRLGDLCKGYTSCEILDAVGNQEIRAIWIMGENVLVSHPEQSRTSTELQSLDLVVCQDIYLNRTSQFADVIFPVCSGLEVDGTVTSTERRVQRIRPIRKAPGESREDWDVLCDISRRMGYAMPKYKSSEEIFQELVKCVPIYSGITYENLGYGLQWPVNFSHPLGTEILHRKSKHFKLIATCYSPPNDIVDNEYPLILTTGRNLFSWNTGVMSSGTDGPYFNEGGKDVNVLEMNANDSSERMIDSEGQVFIKTKRGVIKSDVKITDIEQGAVLLVGGDTNQLSGSVFDPNSKVPEMTLACQVASESVDVEKGEGFGIQSLVPSEHVLMF